MEDPPPFPPSGVLSSRLFAPDEAGEEVGPSLLLPSEVEGGERAQASKPLRPGRIYNLHTLRERMKEFTSAEEGGKASRGRKKTPNIVPLSHEALADQAKSQGYERFLEGARKEEWGEGGRGSSCSFAQDVGLTNRSTLGSESRRMHPTKSGPSGASQAFPLADATRFLRRQWCPQYDSSSDHEAAICQRTAHWLLRPSGDTALYPLHGNRPDWAELDEAEKKILGPKNRNYHLYARKEKAGGFGIRSAMDSLEEGERMSSTDRGLGSTTSTLVLNMRTHRLERRSRTKASVEKAAKGRVRWQDEGEESDGGVETGEGGGLLSDEKMLQRVAVLMEAFERSGPNAAGWLFLRDFKWTLHRDPRVQEIFGLEKKQYSLEKKSKRKEGHAEEESTSQGPLKAVVSWIADTVFRNRDEPVTFTKKSQVKVKAMLDQLRRIESDLISNERTVEEAKIAFDTFAKAFWPFVGKSLTPDTWRQGLGVYRTVATQKDTPYALTATQMMVRDSILGVNIASDELRLPDFVELPRLGLMEKPDLSLAHEVGTDRKLHEKAQSLERLRFTEASSPFQQSFADVIHLEKDLAEYQVLKQQLDRVSREAFLSAPSESLARFLAVIRDRAGHMDSVEELAREAGIFRAPPTFKMPSAEHEELREHQTRMREKFGEETTSSQLVGVSAVPTALVSDDEDDEGSPERPVRAAPVIPKNLPPLKSAPKIEIRAKVVPRRSQKLDDTIESDEAVECVRDEKDDVSSLSEDE
uniref:Uncharacterized protein n=1 Tax=Toxoplasma gondii COUG TaxID=1074873 RepID=A0A2G8Y3P0_TOXGO|nr:hypothetical protein TGCOUG_289990 [Toxoplasma gondii COUG]